MAGEVVFNNDVEVINTSNIRGNSATS